LLLLAEPEPLGLELEPEDALPGLAGLFVVSLELDDGLDGEELEPDADDDGDDGLDGEVLLDGAALEPREALLPLLALRSQPVTSAVPSASDTARASVDNLMKPPLGWGTSGNSK
jgi:hypothetical protein